MNIRLEGISKIIRKQEINKLCVLKTVMFNDWEINRVSQEMNKSYS